MCTIASGDKQLSSYLWPTSQSKLLSPHPVRNTALSSRYLKKPELTYLNWSLINRYLTGLLVFTARCTLVQSAVLRSHVVCLSVTLMDCDHIGWNSSEIISPLVSLGCSLSADPNIMGLLQGEHPEILAQSDPPPVDLSVGDIRSQIAAEWLQI